jgi:hypothetical protein
MMASAGATGRSGQHGQYRRKHQNCRPTSKSAPHGHASMLDHAWHSTGREPLQSSVLADSAQSNHQKQAGRAQRVLVTVGIS